MRITPFAIERYFARYEFTARHLLSSSDCEALTLEETLAVADPETRALWDGLRLSYTDSWGHPLLRGEIASLYQGVGPDQVLEVVPEEGILLAMQSLLEPGDHVVATWPAYQSLLQIARDMGCEVTPWRVREDAGWRFDLADLEAALRPTTRIVVVNFPHNPTGALPTRDELRRLVDLVETRGIRLFCDEMYRWLEADDAARLPSAVELSSRAVVLCGLSKSLSAPGLRVGWLVTHDRELRERLAVAKDYTTICGSAPAEILALAILRNRERIWADNRARITSSIAAFDAFLSRWPGMASWTPPAAGPVGMVRLEAGEGAAAFCTRAVEEADVMLLPSTVFDFGDSHVRIGLGRSSFGDALAALEGWLNHQPTRGR
jgi:aspartate/methionine/tyrosine aminotransferase